MRKGLHRLTTKFVLYIPFNFLVTELLAVKEFLKARNVIKF